MTRPDGVEAGVRRRDESRSGRIQGAQDAVAHCRASEAATKRPLATSTMGASAPRARVESTGKLRRRASMLNFTWCSMHEGAGEEVRRGVVWLGAPEKTLFRLCFSYTRVHGLPAGHATRLG